MRRAAVALGLAIVAGCAAAPRTDTPAPEAATPPSAPPDDGTYAAPITPPPPAAAAPPSRTPYDLSVEPPAATPAIMKATFEDASAQCNDWPATGADAIRSVPSHSGDYACRICATGDVPDIAIGRAGGALDAGRYVLTAWVRTRPDSVGPSSAIAFLEADTAGGTVTASAPVALDDDYARLLVTLDLAAPATALRARIGAAASAKQCVLIDDVLVERVP